MKIKCLLPFCSVLLFATLLSAAEKDYPIHPDSQRTEGIPHGTIQKYSLRDSHIFPGTDHDYWLYIPAQYTADKPACVYINQDGIQYNAPTVFDNLIAKKEMPITIGVFVTPGILKAPAGATNTLDRYNRSFEYDGLGPDYARFVLEELLPDVESKSTSNSKPIRLSQNPNDRCLGGASSGAICAFTAAWERPDAFSRVFSCVGTYVGLRGGHVYPTLIRKFEPKPIRVFLQDGANDLNIYAGDWWMANQTMERALVFAGYQVDHVWGEGEHNTKHATAIFPDAMRFLWRDWPQPVKSGPTKNAFLNDLLLPGQTWESVGQGYTSACALAANERGEVFFSDLAKSYKLGSDGTVTELPSASRPARSQAFGPDGKRYLALADHQEIVACAPSGQTATFTDGIRGRDLVVSHNGLLYATEPPSNGQPTSRVWLLKPDGAKQIADSGLKFASGITLSPDQSLLYVADSESHWIYSYQIQSEGTLRHKQRYFWLHCPDDLDESGAGGMCCDRDGRLYVATAMGIQVCDQAGRVECIIPTPNGRVANLAFGGERRDTLFAACGDHVFKRKLKVQGALPFLLPVKPAPPHL